MFWLTIALLGQVGGQNCIGTNDTLDCRTADGATYIERRIGDQVIRQGTDRAGQTWTEYVTPIFDGTRTVGVDSSGRTWTLQCNPRFGTTGNNRNGEAVFIPPPRTGTNGKAPANPCG